MTLGSRSNAEHELRFTSRGVNVDTNPQIRWSGDLASSIEFGIHRVEVSGKLAVVTLNRGTSFEITGSRLDANLEGNRPLGLSFDLLNPVGLSPEVNGVIGNESNFALILDSGVSSRPSPLKGQLCNDQYYIQVVYCGNILVSIFRYLTLQFTVNFAENNLGNAIAFFNALIAIDMSHHLFKLLELKSKYILSGLQKIQLFIEPFCRRNMNCSLAWQIQIVCLGITCIIILLLSFQLFTFKISIGFIRRSISKRSCNH